MKVRHAPTARRRTKKILERAKGYWGERSKKVRRALETTRKALAYAYRDRRNKKRTFRALWIVRINAAARERGVTYTTFMHNLKEKGIILSRDMLAKIAAEHPKVFDEIFNVSKN